MTAPDYIAPLLLGLAGSLHCVGMCGPLLLALPLPAASIPDVTKQILTYHLGRILTYALLGLLFGLLGKGLAVAGLQKALSLLTGVLMIALAFISRRFDTLIARLPGFEQFTHKVQSGISRQMRAHPGRARFSMGLLNGLLPCGMVYTALAGAISTAGPQGGAGFMLVFGLGTWPLLFAVTWLGRSFQVSLRRHMRLAQPVLLTLAGLLLLQRGLHLDLSLFESAVPRAGYECH